MTGINTVGFGITGCSDGEFQAVIRKLGTGERKLTLKMLHKLSAGPCKTAEIVIV